MHQILAELQQARLGRRGVDETQTKTGKEKMSIEKRNLLSLLIALLLLILVGGFVTIAKSSSLGG